MTTPQHPEPEQPDSPQPWDYLPPPAYPPAGQVYPPPGQVYPPAGQVYPPAGQAYPPPGQPTAGPYSLPGYQPVAPDAYRTAPDAFSAAAPVRQGSNRKGLAIGLALRIGIPVLLLVIGLIWTLSQFQVANVRVGDCLVEDGTDSVKTVKCDDPSADYQVVAVLEDSAEPTDFTNPCQDVADADASYWEGTQGGTGRILCLREL